MFINVLPSIFDNTVDILLFADDAKIFSTIYSPSDALNLQANLDKFVIWTHQNSLSLNINKCNVITFSRIDNPISFDYKIDNCSVTRATSIRDLGIIIDCNLSFTTHINTITKKSFKMLGFINRNTVNFKNINALKILFFALVRSHLEFGSIVWSPYYITFINTIENVQLKFLKLLCYKLNIPLISKNSYNMRMSKLSFISCEVRRKVADIMFIYHLLNGHIFSPDLLSMIAFNTANHCLRKSNLFHIPFYNNNYSSTSYFSRALKLANLIVDHVDFFFMSRNVFKRNVYLVLNDVVN